MPSEKFVVHTYPCQFTAGTTINQASVMPCSQFQVRFDSHVQKSRDIHAFTCKKQRYHYLVPRRPTQGKYIEIYSFICLTTTPDIELFLHFYCYIICSTSLALWLTSLVVGAKHEAQRQMQYDAASKYVMLQVKVLLPFF
jgi:hypothetical protein